MQKEQQKEPVYKEVKHKQKQEQDTGQSSAGWHSCVLPPLSPPPPPPLSFFPSPLAQQKNRIKKIFKKKKKKKKKKDFLTFFPYVL